MSSNESYLERFLVEEWIAKRLDNEHILKAFIPNRKRHSLYMVTEYIEGQNLHQWMIDNPKPSVEAVRKIIEQAAKGLQDLHRQEMVHQDLRPNNIMIDSNGTIKIIDFGATKVAGIVEMGHDQEGIQGTLLYTAPEYFLGETGGANSDLFSLGTIAYQMLTGSLSYGINVSKSTNKASQRKLSYQHIPNDKNIPVWIDLAIKQAVHINPLKRYVEVSEFAYDLRHPNKKFAHKTKPPIIERNPVAFWKMISVILVIIIIIQALN